MLNDGDWAGCLACPTSAGSNRLGWHEGFHVLLAVNPIGVITGFGFSSASTKDSPLAETFFALRACPDPRVTSFGVTCGDAAPALQVKKCVFDEVAQFVRGLCRKLLG